MSRFNRHADDLADARAIVPAELTAADWVTDIILVDDTLPPPPRDPGAFASLLAEDPDEPFSGPESLHAFFAALDTLTGSEPG